MWRDLLPDFAPFTLLVLLVEVDSSLYFYLYFVSTPDQGALVCDFMARSLINVLYLFKVLLLLSEGPASPIVTVPSMADYLKARPFE